MLAPYVIVLAAFAFRMYASDTTWVDKDRANPHAIGLIIVDTIRAGRFADLPLFSDPASIQLPNPPVISYFWSLIALFDRSLFAANAVGLMLNVAAVAITYRLARKLFTWEAAVVAATLMAASNWGVYLARGTWHPGHLEIGVVLCTWLLASGVHRRNPRNLVRGFILVVLTAGTDMKAFALFAQSVAATVMAGATGRSLRKAWLAGMGICAAGLLLYGLALAVSGELNKIVSNSLLSTPPAFTAEDLAARDVTEFNRQTIPHFFRLVSNADYALIWTNPAIAWHAARVPITQAMAGLISLAVLAGALVMVRGWRLPAHRFLLTWAGVPIVVLMAIAALKPEFRVPPYYLLVASPVMYLCGGLGAALVLRRVKASAAATLLTCLALMVVPAWNFYAAAQTVYTQPYFGMPAFMPLRWATRLGALMREKCRTLNGPGNLYEWWAISLAERPDIRRDEGARINELSAAWSVEPAGGACTFKQDGPPMPNAELLWVPLDDGSRLRVDRALPFSGGNAAAMSVNLGWTLLDFDAPLQAAAGTTLTVRHAWRVDSLPAEPYGEWYYAPFIKLRAADGRVVADVNRATAILGWGWRAGELILSDVQISLPPDLAPGRYTIESSLFDPNQKKNAVYFAAAAPGQPILALTRGVEIIAR